MRNLLVSLSLSFLSLILITNFSYAQSTANYAFATNNNGTLAQDMNGNAVDMTTGSTSLLPATTDDTSSPLTNIGFDFFFMGSRQNQFAVSDNGILRLGGTVTTNLYAIPSTTQLLITAFANDKRVGTDGVVRYKVVGTAPNRTLVVEYNNIMIGYISTAAAGTGTWQMRLYETTGVIEYVYGSMNTNSAISNYIVGFSNNSTANNIVSVNTVANTASTSATVTTNALVVSSTIPELTSASDGNRRYYRFTAPVPTAPTALNFTGVTTGGMTLNWTDNSTELGFAIYRSEDGGTTYNYVSTTAANATSSVQSGLLPGTSYFWRVYAVSEGGLSSVLAGSQATVAGASITSNGTGGGNWSLTSTWAGGVVPGSADNVVIKDGDVVTVNQAATINALTVGEGVSGTLNFDGTSRTMIVTNGITVATGGIMNAGAANVTHILNIGGSTATGLGTGSLTVNGAFDGYVGASAGKFTITFFGGPDAAISGAGTINFNTTSIVNKGAVTSNATTIPPVLDVQRGYTVQGATTAGFVATHTAGTIKLSGTYTLSNPVYSTVGYSIPANGGFWINNPNFTVTGLNGSPTVNGLLKLTTGTLNVGTATGNSMGAAATAAFLFEGGTSNFTGRFQNSAACVFTMSGGTMNVCTIGNAASSSASFGLTGAATVTMSGGTINIVQATGGTTPLDWRVAGAIVGTVGTTVNFGTAATTATARIGFRACGSLPNVNIDNTGFGKTLIDTLNGTTNTVVYGTMTVNTGCVWNINNGSTATYTNFMLGSTITNNGIIQGTGSSTRIDFQGATAQSYGGTGTFGTNAAPIGGVGVGIANLNNVTLNATVISVRFNLFTGTLVNSNFAQIGGGGSAGCFLQRGGSTGNPSGSFDQAPVFNLGTGTLGYSYSTASTAVTTSFEIPATRTITSMTLNNVNGITLAGGNLNISLGASPALTMTLGSLNLGGNTLTLGSSATVLGTLTNTTGVIMNGTLTRWFGTTASPTTIANSNGGHFPMGTGTLATPINRNLWLSFSGATALSTGGTISVTHNASSGITAITPFDDGGYSVENRTNTNWAVSQSGCVLTGTINARMQASSPGFAVGTVANLRMIRATDAVGTHSAGTNTAADPQVNRTALDLSMLANTFYLGGNNADMSVLITWIGTSGLWSDAANWSSNPAVPASSDNVSISPASASNITIDGNYAVNDITIGTNATISLGSNTLTVNRDFIQNAGTLNLGSGNMEVKRNFTRSGGTLTPGTSTVSFTSTVQTQTIDFSAGGTSLNNVLFSGGASGTFTKTFTSGRTLTASGDYTVQTTAQLALSSATSTTHNAGGNLVFGGASGGANMGSLTINLTGTGKTIDGSATDNITNTLVKRNNNSAFIEKVVDLSTPTEVRERMKTQLMNTSSKQTTSKEVSKSSEVAAEDKSDAKNSGDKAAKSNDSDAKSDKSNKTSVNNSEVVLVNTYDNLKGHVDELIAARQPNEILSIVLDDRTIVINPSFNNTDTPVNPCDVNVTVASTGAYTLGDNITMPTGRTLTVNGRLDAADKIISGAGTFNLASVTTAFLGISTASPNANGGTVTTTTQSWGSGTIDYNAAGDQSITANGGTTSTGHNPASVMMLSGSGIKSITGDLYINATVSATITGVQVNSGTTFNTNGNMVRFNNDGPSDGTGRAIVINTGGGFNNTSGVLRFHSNSWGCGIYAPDGINLGAIRLSFSSSTNNVGINAVGVAPNINIASMLCDSTAGGTLRANCTGITNVTVTGDVNLSPTVLTNSGGGFNSVASAGTVKLKGNIISLSTSATQDFMTNGIAGNILEFNGTSAQTITVPAAVTAATIFTGTTMRINNSAGVTLTNNDASGCTFTIGSGGAMVQLAGSIALGDADILGFSGTNSTMNFSNGTITDANWPTLNGPQNVVIGASATLPGDRTIPGTFTLTNGILTTGAFTLTVGTSASSVGSISYTSGAVRGNLRRWFGTTTTSNTLFPMDDNTGQYVPGTISFTVAPGAGGTITARFTSTGGGTNGLPIIPGVSGSDSITTASDQFWTYAAGDGLTGGTYNIDLTGTNFPGVTDYTTLALLKRVDGASPWTWSAGVHSATTGSNSAPVIHGIGFTSFSDFALGGGGQGQNPLPVELSAFTSSVSVQNVNLKWTTTHEQNNSGFDIERAEKKGAELTWGKVGHVAGNGNSNNAINYSFEDKKVASGKYAYRLKQIDFNGNYHYYQLANEVEVGVPKEFNLSQNYPNPFNPSTKVDYSLPFDSKVDIRIFDMTGREVMVLENATQTAGYHTLLFNASALSSGTYFYRIIANGGNQQFVKTLKMTLVK